jgi:cytochrome c peroxidase
MLIDDRGPTSVLIRVALTSVALSACISTTSDAASDGEVAVTSPALSRVATHGDSAKHLRQFIERQIGDIDALVVPSDNRDLPQPRLAGGSPDPRFATTEAKRYLGKQLYFDPIRTARIKPEFGGVLATRQSGSCGTCHLGEAAGKSATRINFGVGGEGRGYTDAEGNFHARRRPRIELSPLRTEPLFEGDALVDELPTLTDIYEFAVGNPGRGRRSELPPAGMLLRTGRLDALDSVARNAPAMIGFAFNNRLLLGGLAGEPDTSHGAINPFGFAAQESLTQLTLDAHRMQDDQAAELQKFATYRALFRDAFPDEAAQADAAGDLDLLVNDQTVLRAMARFLRTVVTRNTPWDRFLAGHDGALTKSQRRGAKLFFTPATQGGAGCFSCHSGPQFNKQPSDPDIAGAGELVEENFYNLGLGDHPVQALNVAGRKDPKFRDDGRREITFRDEDAFKFRVLTLRQLRDGKFFFHDGSFTSVRDVVEYFNAGVPKDAEAGAAPTLTPRFTNPRGDGSVGLGLNEDQVTELSDFLENALYDPAFVHFDPESTTETFAPNERDLSYSIYRPDLAALGATDGRMPSGRPFSNDDALSRRDMGLEFLDVTAQLSAELIGSSTAGNQQADVYRITNTSASIVDTHLLVIARGLPANTRIENGEGCGRDGDPYRRIFLADGVLLPGHSIEEKLVINRASHGPRIEYALAFLSGQGNP